MFLLEKIITGSTEERRTGETLKSGNDGEDGQERSGNNSRWGSRLRKENRSAATCCDL